MAAIELRCVAVCAVVVVVLRAQLARVGLRRGGAVRSLVAVALFGQFAGRSARARPDRRTQRTWDVHTDVSRMPGRGPAPSLDASKCNRRSCSASPVRCRGVVVAVNQPLRSGAPLTADGLKAPHLVAQPNPLRNQREPWTPCQFDAQKPRGNTPRIGGSPRKGDVPSAGRASGTKEDTGGIAMLRTSASEATPAR